MRSHGDMGQNRRWPKTPKPPILMGEVRAAGAMLGGHCPICPRTFTMDPNALSLPDDADMARVSAALKCTGCGRRGGIDVGPHSEPWIKWLRRTGQRERVPWNGAFVRDEEG